MDLPMDVIDAYDTARAQGQSRADALLGAVSVYIARRPDLSISEAGNEVVRILRQAAERTAAAESASVRVAGTPFPNVHEHETTSAYGR